MIDTTEEQNAVLKKALTHYGEKNQLNQTMEEASELVTACNHYLRKNNNSRSELISEIADVYIMLKQLTMILGEEAVKEEMAFKIDRLQERLSLV